METSKGAGGADHLAESNPNKNDEPSKDDTKGGGKKNKKKNKGGA